MPHIIVEYSKGIAASLDIEKLVDNLHAKAMTIDALPVGGLRTRAHGADASRVGDGKADREFIYITVRLGEGREEDVKLDIGEQLYGVLTEFTAEHFSANKALSLGLEIQEIEKFWTWKKNNIHQIIKDETDG